MASLAYLLSLSGCGQESPPNTAPVIQFESLDGGYEAAPREGRARRLVPKPPSAASGSGDSIASEPGRSPPEPGTPPSPEPAEVPLAVIESSNDEGSVSSDPSSSYTTEQVLAQLADGTPKLAATTIATTVYSQPHQGANKIGYIRLGGVVRREAQASKGTGCKGAWYGVQPTGYVCTEEATTQMSDPLVLATQRRPDLDRPLPYSYGFVRATAPQYLRIPTFEEQKKSEFKLEEHLDWYQENYLDVQRVVLGANDVPLDEQGFAVLGKQRINRPLSTQLTTTELLGGTGARGEIPFWLAEGRAIPNVSGFEVPSYAVFADRVRRKTGLSFVDAFVATDPEADVSRRFAVTVDMRLIPATKVKPDTGSPFHGVALTEDLPMPLAFIVKRGTKTWKLLKGKDEAKEADDLPHRALVPLSGKARIKAGRRFYQLARSPQRWVQASDVGVVSAPPDYPQAAEAGEKWIDVSLVQQTLTLYEGKKPVYATLVSTGRDRLGDPETSLATPQGEFRINSKHIAAAMDSEENSNVSGGQKSGRRSSLSAEAKATVARLLKAEEAGTPLSDQDQRRLKNIKKGRHPEYGVTRRRGAGDYELRDVPWIQYFAAGYALHGAYWHDVFGVPRSHGCINLAPIDARLVFFWTAPEVPTNWHGINTGNAFGQGTLVRIRE